MKLDRSGPDTILVIGMPPVNLSHRVLTYRFNELVTISTERPLTRAERREIRRIDRILRGVDPANGHHIAPLTIPPLPTAALLAPWMLSFGVLALMLTAEGKDTPGLWIFRLIVVLIAIYGAANMPDDGGPENGSN